MLYDDREVSPGEKMADADLLGMPWRLIQSEKTGAKKIEVKKRDEKNVEILDIEDVIKRLKL